jgi:ankyrin repeat protein
LAVVEQFKDAIQKRDAAGVRTLLAAHPDLRSAINQPLFNSEPAIVFSRRDPAMVDVLLDFGADINARSQFWGRTVGVLDENTEQMRTYLIARGAIPEIDEFVEAVGAGQTARVRTLLTTTPAVRPYIDRPLFPFGAPAVVAAKDDREMVATLLEFGADINARSDWWAGGFGVLDSTSADQAAWLISRGALVDIHAAAALGMIERVKEWLARDPSLVHAPGGDGQRPLHFASTKEIVGLLLEHGAEIDARDTDHRSTAAQYKVKDAELCRYLIQCGAAVDIFMAAALGDRELVEQVLDVDPESITARIGEPGYEPVPPGHIYQWKLDGGPSVLMVAAKDGGPEIYEFLRTRSPLKERFLAACQLGDEHNASKALVVNPNLLLELAAADRAQIVQAAFSHNLPALKVMLSLGFDVNTRGGEGFTPVSRAALRGDVEIVRMLIQHRADLEVRNDYGGTALESCQWGSLNFRDRQGDYPACAEALVQSGAKLSYPHFGSEAVQAVLRRYAAH